MNPHVEPHVHEAKAYLHFRDHGLSPYWTLRNLVIHELDGHGNVEAEIGGKTYEIDIAYSDSGIAPRESDAVEREVLRDWELHVEGPGTEEKCHYQIRARFDDMTNPDGEEVSLPWEGGEGLDVFAQPTNIPLDDITHLLRESIDALAESVDMSINMSYLRTPRPSSKITTVEYYVRIARDHARKLVNVDGILHRIMYLLSPEEGTKWSYKGDNTDIVGYRHAMELPPEAVEKLGPYSAGVRAKTYHPKHVRDEETEDDPLSSPKYGIAFHKSIDGETRPFDKRDELRREIEELLINTMEWAGIDTEPDPLVFVSDDHFSVDPSPVEIDVTSDPTPELEADQQSLLMRVLGEVSPAGRDLTRELVTDGGEAHYRDLANQTDTSVSTIYRVLDELKGVVESDRGMVKFTSHKIREEIVGMVNRLDELKESTAERVAELANVDLRSRADSALEKWAAKYGAELVDMDGEGGTIRFDTLLSELRSVAEPNVERVLQEGIDAWTSTGRNRSRFCELRVDADLRDGSKVGRKVGPIVGW